MSTATHNTNAQAAAKTSETTHTPTNDAGGSVLLHVLAVVCGAGMTIVGVGMMMTMVLLPVGIGLAIAGVLQLTWGLYAMGGNQ